MVVIGIFANMGGGKGICGAEIVESFLDLGYTLYTNCECSYPHKTFKLSMISDILTHKVKAKEVFPSGSMLWLQEITQILDSRGSGSEKLNKELSHFFLMSRKLGMDGDYDIGMPIIYDSQFPDLIDKRLWNVTTEKRFCTKHKLEGLKFLDSGNDLVIIEVQPFVKDAIKGDIEGDTYLICANLYYNVFNSQEFVLFEK